MNTLIPKSFPVSQPLRISTDATWHSEDRAAAQGSREVGAQAEGNAAQTHEVYLLYHRGKRLAGFPEGVVAGPAFLSLLFSAVYL